MFKHIYLLFSTLFSMGILSFSLGAWIVLQPVPCSASKTFPRYPVIDKNVRFWEKIYGHYTTSQAVVHDSYNLGIIYTVIPIFDYRLPVASKINKPILKGIKNKYTDILTNLAQGNPPHTSEEKRIAALFGKSNTTQLKQAAGSVRIQIGQQNRFLEGVIKSGAYMDKIRQIFKGQGLPQDLAYLPHVESSFNLKAYSKFGASGIWQFTRSTGKQFLTINYEIDERQDPILASHAAAKFLKKNYTLLGNWPLALTAYNYGPAGMLRAQKAYGSYSKIFSHYDQGYFKFASRNFYSEFLAAVTIAKKLENDPTVQQNKPKHTVHFTLPAFISSQDICKHFKISAHNLKKLNPALRRSVLQGKKYIPKGYTLHLPATQKYKSLVKKVPKQMYHKKQLSTRFYRVRAGDTAGKIARQYRVSQKALQQANNLNKTAAIFIGQNLRIPDKGYKGSVAKNNRSSRKKATAPPAIPHLTNTKKQKPAWKNIQNVRSVVLGELSVRDISRTNGRTVGTITVQPQESVELLADLLKVSTASLRKLNNFSAIRKLHPDEKFIIILNHISAKKFEEKRFDFHLETEEDFFNSYKIVGVSTYKVKQGDTIWKICRKKFDLPLWLLKKYNSKLNFNNLRSSQQLTIPTVKAI